MQKDRILMSIANFLYTAGKGCPEGKDLTYIMKEIPEGMKTPAIYFPNPEVQEYNDTLSTYMLTYSWFIKVFGKTNEEAYAISHQIQKVLSGCRLTIPILNEDGTETEQFVRLQKPQVRQIDSHISQLTISFDIRKGYDDCLTDEENITIFDPNITLI